MKKLGTKLFTAIIATTFMSIAVAQEEICPNFAESVRSCTPDSCNMPHPLTKDGAIVEVKGMQGDKCVITFLDRSDNSGSECKYFGSELEKQAENYATYLSGGNISSSSSDANSNCVYISPH